MRAGMDLQLQSWGGAWTAAGAGRLVSGARGGAQKVLPLTVRGQATAGGERNPSPQTVWGLLPNVREESKGVAGLPRSRLSFLELFTPKSCD